MPEDPKTRSKAFEAEGIEYTTEAYKGKTKIYLTNTMHEGESIKDITNAGEFVPEFPELDDDDTEPQTDIVGSLFFSNDVVDATQVPEGYEHGQMDDDEGFIPFTIETNED